MAVPWQLAVNFPGSDSPPSTSGPTMTRVSRLREGRRAARRRQAEAWRTSAFLYEDRSVLAQSQVEFYMDKSNPLGNTLNLIG